MLKIGIIGLGYWGPNLLRNFCANDKCSVVIACDLLDKNLRKINKNYHNIKLTKDYREILKEGVELVCIATSPSTHFEIAKYFLKNGINVLIEKPMTTKVGDALALLELSYQKNLKIFIDHPFVFSPPVRKIKELMKNGRLGKVWYVDSERVNLGLLQNDVTVIWDLAPHDFSIFNYLFECLPVSVQVVASRHKHPYCEDLAHIVLKYDNKFIAHIDVSWLSPVKIRKMIIGGEKGMILYNDIDQVEPVKFYEKRIEIDVSKVSPFHPVYLTGDIWCPKVDKYEPLAKMVENVVNTLYGSEQPVVDGYEGLKVVKLLEACDKSVRNNGREVMVGEI
ncbi:MAG: gfo/Idh/MocA family oxidoreductase [Candidatus Thorarchaeota archaeon]|nr:MAG: gfo/Idh/MocA family oxidoreductase [Candidatus Thorarchaeota archaeon]